MCGSYLSGELHLSVQAGHIGELDEWPTEARVAAELEELHDCIRAGAAKWFIINTLKTILLHGPGREDGSALALRIVLTCEVGILRAA